MIAENINLLEEIYREILILAWALMFLDMTQKAQTTKAKIDKLLQTLKLLRSKRSNQRSEREIYRMEENIDKL